MEMEMDTKIAAAVALDRLSGDYRVAFTPQEAVEIVTRLPAVGKDTPKVLRSLVENLNAAIPRLDFGVGNSATGRPAHKFHIGHCEQGRLLIVEVLSDYLPKECDWLVLAKTIEDLADRAGASGMFFEDDDPPPDVNRVPVTEIRMWWEAERWSLINGIKGAAVEANQRRIPRGTVGRR